MFWWKTPVRVFVHWGGQDLGLRVYDGWRFCDFRMYFEAVSWFEELPCRVLMMRSVISRFRTSGIGVCTVIL